MKVHIRIMAYCLLLGFSVILACKKTESAIEKTPEVPDAGSDTQKNALIPIQMGSGKSKMVFSYTENNSLTKIEYGGGTSTVLEYNTAGKPTALMRYKGPELLSFTQYWLDKNGVVVKARKYIVADNEYNDTGNYILTYNTESRLTNISYYDLLNVLINTSQKYYSASGNLIKDRNSTDVLTTEYVYDDKNGLFKNANYSWLFAIEEENTLFLSCINNIKTCSYALKPGMDQNFSYTYNTDKYPATVTSVSNGITVSYKVTYKKAE
jgi:hypothetical protein